MFTNLRPLYKKIIDLSQLEILSFSHRKKSPSTESTLTQTEVLFASKEKRSEKL